MDDLVALFGDEDQSKQTLSDDHNERSKTGQVKSQPTKKAALSVDDRIGIRMKNRLVCGDDLSTLLIDYPYHSTAQLSTYSLQHLNTLLDEPTAIIDISTVAGNTSLVTVGIVFSNSGSRISAAGNPFCIVKIGTLRTGPTVSVLLFGGALHQHCRTARPGKVVALLQPRLLPKQQQSKDETTVTFSLSDAQQLRMVAEARDYGICKGVNETRTGQRKCSQFVDVRISRCCKKHSRTSQGSVKPVVSKMEQLRAQHGTRKMVPPRTTSVTRPVQPHQTKQGQKLAGNSLLNPQSALSRGGRPMAATTTSKPSLTRANSISVSNPYANRPPRKITPSPKTELTGTKKGRLVKHDILQTAIQTKPKRKLNIDNHRHFDGLVAVPQPRKIRVPQQFVNMQQHRHTIDALEQRRNQKLHERIQESQRTFAQKLQNKKETKKPHTRVSSERAKGQSDSTTDSFQSAFGSVENAETTLQSQSQFVTQADAEDYLRFHKLATELEKKEATGKNKTAKPKGIITTWHCVVCQRSFQKNPRACLKSGHSVRVERKLPQNETIGNKRQKLTETSAADGGLVLGSGIEWTRFQTL